jgi:hypothetical protein
MRQFLGSRYSPPGAETEQDLLVRLGRVFALVISGGGRHGGGVGCGLRGAGDGGCECANMRQRYCARGAFKILSAAVWCGRCGCVGQAQCRR